MIYLYVKTHTKTGLKYLGKTISKNPHSYPGSGKVWKRHLEKHGKYYTTRILLVTENKSELIETGKFFSKLWNVAKSEEWANLIPEHGDGGRTQDHLLAAGLHNFQNSDVQRKIQMCRVKKGTHNLQSCNRTFSRKGCKHPKTAARNLTEDNKFRHNVPCIDKDGHSIMVSKDQYYSQTGEKQNWEYVHTRSKEAGFRRKY